MNWLLLISSIVAIVSTCLYINNIIVDINSAMISRYSITNTDDDEQFASKMAKYRIILSFIMGISWGIVICL